MERQTDGHTKRPHGRSPKVIGPRQGDTWWARDRDMDRHAMQSEIGYLFGGLWKGRRGKSREKQRDTEREMGERNGARQKLPLWLPSCPDWIQ